MSETTQENVGRERTKSCATDSEPRLLQECGDRLRSLQLLSMQRVFSRHGGMLTGDEMANTMRRHFDQPISELAKSITARSIVSFCWKGQWFVPAFQFDWPDYQPRRVVESVIVELRDVYDDWALAQWFAEPSVWLDGALPVDLLANEEFSVVCAARTDRYIARG